MGAQPVVLIVEDELSDAVMQQLILASHGKLSIDRIINVRGNGQIKANVKKFALSSYSLPHVVLTDLDRHVCPATLRKDWRVPTSPTGLLFCVAVREVEAWLLADRDGIANFLQIPATKVPMLSENIENPKEALINLARRSRKKRLVHELVPEPGSAALIGPLYNARMSEFVRHGWDIQQAKTASRSLERTLNRLSSFCRGLG